MIVPALRVHLSRNVPAVATWHVPQIQKCCSVALVRDALAGKFPAAVVRLSTPADLHVLAAPIPATSVEHHAAAIRVGLAIQDSELDCASRVFGEIYIKEKPIVSVRGCAKRTVRSEEISSGANI